MLPNFRLPHIAGMDIAGTVVATGDQVRERERWGARRRRPDAGLRVCRNCLAGERAYCEHLRVIGGNVPGGLAEFVAARGRRPS